VDYEKISLGVKAKGKLVPYLCSHLAHLLNEAFDIDLHARMLSFVENKRKVT
jgi:hypothetical protein